MIIIWNGSNNIILHISFFIFSKAYNFTLTAFELKAFVVTVANDQPTVILFLPDKELILEK